MSKNILVVGGTGMLGRPIVDRLIKEDYQVAVLTTNREKARTLLPESVEILEGDVTDIESLKKPIEGKDVVHLNLNSKITPELYQKIEINGCENVSKVAKEMGVQRIGYISGASSRGHKKGIIYLDAKVEAENRIIQSGVPYSIFRASWFYETLPSFIQQGRAVVLGKQPMKFGWLAASDYAEQVLQAYSKDEAANKCFYNLGPEKMTMLDALTRFCKICHPDLEPSELSFGMARMLSNMPGMEKLKLAIPFFEYFSENKEDVDTTETDNILGANKTSIEEWSEQYKVNQSCETAS